MNSHRLSAVCFLPDATMDPRSVALRSPSLPHRHRRPQPIQAPLQADLDEPALAVDLEAFEEVVDVLLHGELALAHALGDLGVSKVFGHEQPAEKEELAGADGPAVDHRTACMIKDRHRPMTDGRSNFGSVDRQVSFGDRHSLIHAC